MKRFKIREAKETSVTTKKYLWIESMRIFRADERSVYLICSCSDPPLMKSQHEFWEEDMNIAETIRGWAQPYFSDV